MTRLIEELKRRNVLRAAALYAAGAWLLVQVATQVFPFFDIPNWAVRLVVVAVLVGFPFAMLISWFYELTPSGFKRETEPGQGAPAGSIWRGRGFRAALLCACAVALTVLIAAAMVSRRADPAHAAGGSIAVLPFRNLSASADNAYFAEGIQEEILTRLTGIGALRVIARSSTARYAAQPEDLPRIGRELGVDNLLEGSVQRHEDEVRINVQLVRADNRTNLWSETYDRKLTDIFGVESEVARAVATALKTALSGAEQHALDDAPAVDPQAYEQYLRGMTLYKRSFQSSNLQGAAMFLRRAVQLDPGFAAAWALLAQVDAGIAYQVVATPGLCDQAGAEAATALRLAPRLGQAHRAQGYYLYLCKSDLDGARSAFEQARQELPGDVSLLTAIGDVERRRGNLDQAADSMRQATQLDPRNTGLIGDYALTLAEARRFDEAHAAADQVLNLIPDDRAMIGLQVSLLQAQGRLEPARALLAPIPGDPQDSSIFDTQMLQLLYQGRAAEAVTLLRGALAQDLSAAGIGAGDYWYLLGVALRAGADQAGARRAFADGRAYVTRLAAAAQSPDTRLYRDSLLCLYEAGAGDAAPGPDCAAVAAAAAAGGLFAPSASEALARAAALRGDADTVIAALPQLLRAGYYSNIYSIPLTPALLRQDPVWDSVRGDPRFKVLAETG